MDGNLTVLYFYLPLMAEAFTTTFSRRNKTLKPSTSEGCFITLQQGCFINVVLSKCVSIYCPVCILFVPLQPETSVYNRKLHSVSANNRNKLINQVFSNPPKSLNSFLTSSQNIKPITYIIGDWLF